MSATWAEQLYAAREARRPIAPLSEVDGSLTVDDAYAIQQQFTAMLVSDGARVLGYKLGLTSKPMQDMLGVAQPDFGPVLSSMSFPSGGAISVDRLIQPRIEAEIALELGAGISGPGVTRYEAKEAVIGARAALEIIDSRIEDWRITLVDTVADLASTAAVVLGDASVPLEGWDPRLCGAVIYRDGELMATGAGAAALGDPLDALAWLANTLGRFGTQLEEGHVVLTGSLHAAFAFGSGDVVSAEFDRLGPVSIQAT